LFHKILRLGICLVIVLSLGAPLAAADEYASDRALAQQDQIDALEEKVDLLTRELARVKEEVVVPEETPTLESYRGLGPAASKVYAFSQGLSIGGYAEGYYRNIVSDRNSDGGDDPNRADALRTVLYVGYKFNDWLTFNSEFEFEHATTSSGPDAGDGSVSTEFAYLDINYRPELNFRAGLLLVPVGFINEIHEPPYFHGVIRPQVEQQIIPTTWRENGVGLFGTFGEDFEYRIYVTAALDGLGATASNYRGSRQKGNRERAEDLAISVRGDWTPFDGALFGASLYTGEIDHDRPGFPDARLTLWEAHAQYRAHGLELRGLFAQSFLDNADDLTLALRADPDANIFGTTQTIAEEQLGFYVEAAYDVWPLLDADRDYYLAPFFRFEYYDTQRDVSSGPLFSADGTKEIRLYHMGLSFKPHPNVVLKLDYRNFNPVKGEKADDIQLGFGVAF
jgi:hypothetical protein